MHTSCMLLAKGIATNGARTLLGALGLTTRSKDALRDLPKNEGRVSIQGVFGGGMFESQDL